MCILQSKTQCKGRTIVYFTEQNTIQRGGMDLNFELKCKMKYTNRVSSKNIWEKWGHLSSYLSCQKLLLLFGDGSKKSVTVWTKCLSTSERSSLAPSENAFWATISKMSILGSKSFAFLSWVSSFLKFLPSISHSENY